VYMCVKLPSGDLNSNPYSLYSTCGMTIVLKVYDGGIYVIF